MKSLTAVIVCSIVLFAILWAQAQNATAKLIANGEPEQLLLGMRMKGNKFLEVTWTDPHHNNKPQDVTIRTTYKPVITQDGGAWRITFEKEP
jgi:hypothetical protein